MPNKKQQTKRRVNGKRRKINSSVGMALRKAVTRLTIAERHNEAAVKPIRTQLSKRAPRISGDRMTLSPCAYKFARAIAEPFHPSARGACIPVYPSVPSQKTTAFTRFSFAAGTNGFGFAQFTPTLANDCPTSYCTQNNSTLTSVATLTANTVFGSGINSAGQLLANLPYSSAQLTSTYSTDQEAVQGRIISYGVRVTYTGPELYMGGTYAAWASPTHESIFGNADTASGIASLADAQYRAITREPLEVTQYPVSAWEQIYPSQNAGNQTALPFLYPYCGGEQTWNGGYYAIGPAGIGIGVPTIVVQVNGCPVVSGTSPCTFLVDVITHVEYIGRQTAAMATTSHADTAGFEKVSQSAQNIPRILTDEPRLTQWQALIRALKETAHELRPVALEFARGAGQTYGLRRGYSAIEL